MIYRQFVVRKPLRFKNLHISQMESILYRYPRKIFHPKELHVKSCFHRYLREDTLSGLQNSYGRGVPSRSEEVSARRQLAMTRYPCRLACQRAFSGRTLGAPGKETPHPSPRIAWIARRAGRRQVHASPVRVIRTGAKAPPNSWSAA